MASEIRVDKINSLSGVGTVTLSPTGVDIAGITTAATLRATTGIVTSLTAGSLTSLGAVSGTTGAFTGNLTITNTAPQISLVDSDNNSDFSIYGAAGVFNIYDETNSASRLTIASDGTVSVLQGLELSSDLTIPDSIIHSGDTNTKIRFPSADTITAETGGTERFRITSDGKVGINQTPTRELSLHSPDNNNALIHFTNDDTGETSSDGILLGLDGNENMNINHQETGKDINLYMGGSQRLKVDSNGRVIIGAQITVDTGGYYDDITLNNSNTASGEAGGAGLSIVSGSSSYGGVVFSRSNSNARGYVKYDQTNDRLILGTQTTDKIMIEDNTNNGDVHIKTGNIVMDVDGKGISFAATGDGSGTDSSELFDDYEEGTWTPSLPNGNSGTNHNLEYAYYTKIGRQVTVLFYLSSISIPNDSNEFRITGLPYVVTSGHGFGNFGYIHTGNQTNPLFPVFSQSNSRIYFHRSDGVTATWKNSDAVSTGMFNSYLLMGGTYFTST